MTEPSGDGAAPPSLLETLRQTLRSLLAQWLGLLNLAALEARLAALNLVEMIALALCAALFALTTWWLLLAALTVLLVRSGVPLLATLAGIAVLNVLLAALTLGRVRKLGESLRFSATRAVLQGAPTSESDRAAEPETPAA